MDGLTIRRAEPEDALDFSRLILYSAPEFLPFVFGPGIRSKLEELFKSPRNFFSYEYTIILESGGRNIGMALGYSFEIKKKEELRTGLLLIWHLKFGFFSRLYRLLRAQDLVGELMEKEFYLSNIAVDPEFRSKGAGKKLIKEIEKKAKNSHCQSLVLDVETDNERAIAFYKNLGFYQRWERKGFSFSFFRMVKDIHPE